MRTLADVELTQYDFLDFGAGTGGSLQRCAKLFGGRGLGIDIDERKIVRAQAAGAEVVFGNICDLPREPLVRYVAMDNVLEHLPTLEDVARMIEAAVAVARDFVWIVHPSFEDESYLRALGLKQYWHDWTGHRTHLLASDFSRIFRSLGRRCLDIEYRYAAWSSSDPSILPIRAPADQHEYSETEHGPKPFITFSRPVYRQLFIIVPSTDSGHPHT